MKKLMIAISALALTAGMASAQQVTGEGPVWDAWNSSAGTHPPLDVFPPRHPTTPQTVNPLPPADLVIGERRYKTCDVAGQCAFVDQVGNGNDVDINQSSAPGGSVADVVQIGNDNAASIEQRGGAGSHYAVATQNGNENKAAIRQRSDIITGANYADIHQGGDGTNGGGLTKANGNKASIDQGIGAGGGNVASYGNVAKIRQEGVTFGVANLNEGAIIQRGDRMLSLIEQDGSENTASILQTGTGGGANDSTPEFNQARITQVGLENAAATEQSGQLQKSSIDQNGNFNVASIEQVGVENGVGNTARIDQNGNTNTSVIGQDGDGNMASSVQNGNDNFSSIWQDGNGNMAAAFQNGNGNYSAIEQMGNVNVASVLQNGFDFADVQQIGNDNVAAVMQQ